ncbi:immunoglobulin domain-containing protein, partial [Solitalea sp. MAHUQ-68]|nr:immunoglobulin domain-containing protein [Solitalea agri]
TANSYTATTTGQYKVVASYPAAAGGCSATSATVNVTVNPLPTVTVAPAGPIAGCAGDVIVLTATSQAGMNYQWYNGATAVGTNTNTYSATISGNYSVVVTNPATTCSAPSNVVAVTITPIPDVTLNAAGPYVFCQGGSQVISVPAQAGASYQWYNGATSVGTNSNSFTATTSGTYTVVVTFTATTCKATSAAVSVTVNPLPVATISPSGPTTFCSGGSVTLTAPAQANVKYEWFQGATPVGTNSNTLTVSTSGSYTVKVTNTITSCTATSPATVVTVNNTPTVTLNGPGPYTFCQGGSQVISVTDESALGVTYQWYNGATAIPSATANSYTATTTGQYKVVASYPAAAGGCSATSATVNVTVNPLPTVTVAPAGPIAGCAGDVIVLTATSQAGMNYQWYNGATAVGTNTNTYSATTSGNYSVVVTNPTTTCSAPSNVVAVTITPIPDVTLTNPGPYVFCQGGSVTFSVPAQAGASYQWYNGATPVGTNSNSFTATTSGTYTVVVTFTATSCKATSAAVSVTVNPLPVATISPSGPTTFCSGGSVTLTAPAQANVKYEWFQGATPVGTNSNTLTVSTSGSYTVKVTNTITSCTATSPATVVTVNNTPTVTLNGPGPYTFCQG